MDGAKRLEISPPPDLVLTPFDELILNAVNTHRLGKRITSYDLADLIKVSFANLNYNITDSRETLKAMVDNYFKALEGNMPGEPVGKQSFSCNFPEIRDRYNILHSLKDAQDRDDPTTLGDFKCDFQRLVAEGILSDISHGDIEAAYGFPASLISSIIDFMILDLSELDMQDRLHGALVAAVTDYEREIGGDVVVADRDLPILHILGMDKLDLIDQVHFLKDHGAHQAIKVTSRN